MALSKTYLTVNGQIRSEHRSGEAKSRNYLDDYLKIVICCLLLTIFGCAKFNSKEIPNALRTKINNQIENGNLIDSELKSKELICWRGENDVFLFKLKNNGNSVSIVRPMLHYSIKIHCFDSYGVEIMPITKQAINLPVLQASNIITLDVGQEVSGEFSKETINRQYGGLEKCRYIAITYFPSEFAQESNQKLNISLISTPLWSNAVPW